MGNPSFASFSINLTMNRTHWSLQEGKAAGGRWGEGKGRKVTVTLGTSI